MQLDPEEERQLRSVALQNARAVFRARERAERQLVEANHRIAHILDSITDGFAAFDLDWRIIYINRRAREMIRPLYGLDEDLLGRNHWEIFPESVGSPIEEQYRRAMREQKTAQFEAYYEPLQVWFEIRAYPSSQGLSVYFQDITSRKEAEAQARVGRERLELALAAGGLGDWEWAAATDAVTLSARAAEIFGLGKTTTSWTALRELLHPDDRERARLAVEGALADHSDYNIEYRVIRPSGVTTWVLARGRGHYGANRQVLGMTGVVADITDRKRAEEIKFRMAAVVESSDDAIISMDLEANITTWNTGAQRIFGYTAQEMVGRNISVLLPPDREDEEPAILDRLKRGERVEHYETVRLRKDGTLLHVSLTVSPILDSAGAIVGVSKISRDITARKQAEEALREQARTLELLNQTGSAIGAQLDLQRTVQIVIDAATKLCGAEVGALFYNLVDEKGESFRLHAFAGEGRGGFEEFADAGATTPFGPTFREVVRSGDVRQDPRCREWAPGFGLPKGSVPARSYMAVPVVSRNGQIIGGLFFGHPNADAFTEQNERVITGVAAQAAIAIDNARLYEAAQREIVQRKRVADELREAKEALSHHAQRLEEQVTTRTASLTEAVSQLEEFSYSVSHDLRAPLRAIGGYARVLKEEHGAILPPDAHRYLGRIERNIERMERLVRDVLTLSRVARAAVQLHPIPLQAFVEEIVEQNPGMQEPNAILTIDTPHSVIGDEVSLEQALSNLLNNAIKFVAPTEKPVVSVRSEKAGDRVRIWVEDQGLGIPPQQRSKLFGMFQRMPAHLNFEGTGIGLAIVRKAVERMGGHVGMESNEPRGSRFWIDLRGAE